MGLLFRKKKKEKLPPKAPPKWFMVLMVGFLGYAIVDSLLTDRIEKIQEQSRQVAEKQTAKFYFTPLLRREHGGLGVAYYPRDIEAGAGEGAECWAKVAVRYSLHRRDGSVVEDRSGEEAEPLRFTLGRGEVVPALEHGVMGMKVNGKRQITALPSQAFGAEGFSHPELTDKDEVAYEVRLISIDYPENLPVTDFGLRVYADGSGKGRSYLCMDTVAFKLRGWHVNGTPLWTPEQFDTTRTTRIGMGEVPYAIEKALLGMQGKARRTLIVPPGYLQSIRQMEAAESTEEPTEEAVVEGEEKPAAKTPESTPLTWEGLQFPQDEIVLLEVEVLPEETATPTQLIQPAQE